MFTLCWFFVTKIRQCFTLFCFTFSTIVLLVDKVPTFSKRRLLMVYLHCFNQEPTTQRTATKMLYVLYLNQIISCNVFSPPLISSMFENLSMLLQTQSRPNHTSYINLLQMSYIIAYQLQGIPAFREFTISDSLSVKIS